VAATGIAEKMTGAEVDAYIVAAGFKYLWFGLARYWRKRLEADDHAQCPSSS
jgi:hypothetical protein